MNLKFIQDSQKPINFNKIIQFSGQKEKRLNEN